MADELTFLGETDYRGIDPTQALQIAANERENTALAFNIASQKAAIETKKEQLAIEDYKNQTDAKIKMFSELMKKQKDDREFALDEKYKSALINYNNALASNQNLLAEKYKDELEQSKKQKEFLSINGGIKVMTNVASYPLDLVTINALQKMGVNITFPGQPKAKELLVDGATNTYHVLMDDGSTKPAKDLFGKDIKPVTNKGVTINMGDEESKARARARGSETGRTEAEFAGPEYMNKVTKWARTAPEIFSAAETSEEAAIAQEKENKKAAKENRKPTKIRTKEEVIIERIASDIGAAYKTKEVAYDPNQGFLAVTGRTPDGKPIYTHVRGPLESNKGE